MAYRTKYELTWNNQNVTMEQVLDFLAEKGERAIKTSQLRRRACYDGILNQHEPDTWYEHEKDLYRLAKHFAPTMFFLIGLGADWEDRWRKTIFLSREGVECKLRKQKLYLLTQDDGEWTDYRG